MKKLFLVILCLMFITSTYASDCRLERYPLRGEYSQCPRDSYVTSSRVVFIGNFTYTYVRCEEIKLVCEPPRDEEENEASE